MRKKTFLSTLSILAGCSLIKSVFAVCPLCTIAVGAGIGLAEYLGIDDTITGLWVGGLIVSLIIWTITWFNKKKFHFKGRIILTTILYYLVIIVPLYPAGIIGSPINKLWGIDRLILGVAIGSVAFVLGTLSYTLIKRHRGKANFYFQKVAMPVAPLIILSIIFYFITR